MYVHMLYKKVLTHTIYRRYLFYIMARTPKFIDWPLVQRDYQRGTPVTFLSSRHKVTVEQIEERIILDSWEQKSYQVVLELSDEEKAKWQEYIASLSDFESRYNLQKISALIQSEGSVCIVEKAVFDKIRDCVNELKPNSVSTPENLRILSKIFLELRESRFKMISDIGVLSGSEMTGAPLQIVYP